MRFSPRSAAAVASLLTLSAVSCSSQKQSFPAQPVPAQLTDMQANTLAQQYLDQHEVPSPRTCTAEERQGDGWWLYYKTSFDAAAKPPVLSYLIQVHNDGTVKQFR